MSEVVLERELDMISDTLLIIWVLFMVAVPVFAFISSFICKCHYEFKDFNQTEIPYITIDIQGHPMNMIVDSGCSVCMLTAEAVIDNQLEYTMSGKTVNLSAITTDKITSEAITLQFEVGGKDITEDFYIQEIEDFGNFKSMHGITLQGLLGSSFFDKVNGKIDYKNHKLIIN